MRDASIDYDRHAPAYALGRRPDPRIASRIEAALGDARTVVNVGAGTGSYEPEGRHVIAIEPSAGMRAQRPDHAVPAIAGAAEALPLDDDAVDAAMAIATVHHWDDPEAGLRELSRVARRVVVVLSFDLDALARFWLISDYLPEILDDDRARFPPVEQIAGILGGARVEAIPVPIDCTDGFLAAHYARPDAYLDAAVREAQSVWPRLPAGAQERALGALRADLESGAWDARHGHLRQQPSYDGGLRLVVATFPGVAR